MAENECVATKRGNRGSRQAWERAYGPVPGGLHVLHRCDNESCINLDHLWLGTHAENMDDARRKGRVYKGRYAPDEYREPSGHVYGSKHPGAKLTEDIVREIRASDDSQAVLATRYGVSQATISCVRRFYTWRHVA